MQNKVSPLNVFLLLILLGVSWFFWDLSALLPVRILSDLMYECGKALTAVLTGGRVVSVSADIQSGFHFTLQNGHSGLSVAAGYIGAMILGGVVFLLSSVFRFDKLFTMIIGVGLVALSLIFASGGSSLIYAVIFGVALFLVGFLLPGFINDLVLKYIGLLGVFYFIFDIRGDLILPSGHVSEISRIASVWPGSSTVWALVFGGAALFEFFLLSYLVTRNSGSGRYRSTRRGGAY